MRYYILVRNGVRYFVKIVRYNEDDPRECYVESYQGLYFAGWVKVSELLPIG